MYTGRLILVVTVTLLAFGTVMRSSSAQTQSQPIYLAAGLGVDGITVGYSTKSSVTAKFGDDYELIDHNKYAYEMRYEARGIAFWYRSESAEQKIFGIAVRPKSRAFTAGGIVVGQSTLKDVFREYGDANVLTPTAAQTWFVVYKGITFHVERKSSDGSGAVKEKLLKRKIIQIEVGWLQFDMEPPRALQFNKNPV